MLKIMKTATESGIAYLIVYASILDDKAVNRFSLRGTYRLADSHVRMMKSLNTYKSLQQTQSALHKPCSSKRTIAQFFDENGQS